MAHFSKKALVTAVFLLPILFLAAQTNPAITSWTQNTTGLTGYNCSGCTPPVAGSISANVQSVYYDATYSYISTRCIPSYNIGPWTGNPNTPSDQNKIYRIKLNPTNNATHTATPLGAIGIWSNGIQMFNPKDGMSYNNGGIWNRNAYYYEGPSFDACLGHPAPGGAYHNHVNPSCLYNSTLTTSHSPIIGYAFDGYPVYGAFGYANADGTGGIKRMVSSYAIPTPAPTTRTNGPAVSATYPLGCFCEDYVYTAATGDLDQYNGRVSVTPEYPGGIYCYFVTINASGIPQYPFVLGPTYYGTYSATNTVTSIPAGAVQYTLPIELLHFEGKNEGSTNVLNWSTASEAQNRGFEIESSTDGKLFGPIGFVASLAAGGNSTERLDYRFIDASPAAGLVYYRFRQKDFDGGFEYSPIISVQGKSLLPDVQIFPNPVTDNEVHLTVGNTSKDLTVEILSLQGRVLVSRKFSGGEYGRELRLFAPDLTAGLFLLTIEMDGNKVVKSVYFEE